MYCHGSHSVLDYILYTPKTMRVLRLLDLPNHDEVTQEKDLPSTLFPSDHLRISAEFEISLGKNAKL